MIVAGSLFAGIGGIDLGLEQAGMTTAWQCEIDPDCRRVLAGHWPDTTRFEDVTTLDCTGLPTVDVLAGGFPCQDLSVAGRRAGLAGGRSGLFFEFVRVAAALTPAWVLIENVPGLLSSNDGRDMGTVLGALADLGYGWAYRVLDAQYFGVAQRRRRVFIVGHSAGRADRAFQVLFEPESLPGDPPPRRQPGTRVAALIANGVGTCGADDNQAQAGHLIPALISRCGNTLDDQPTGQLVAAFSENQHNEIVETDIAHQLTTGGGKPGQGYPAVRDRTTVRRLTPLECERLQGFPDGWTAQLSDSARYRTLGNAVAVPVAHWIGQRILAQGVLL